MSVSNPNQCGEVGGGKQFGAQTPVTLLDTEHKLPPGHAQWPPWVHMILLIPSPKKLHNSHGAMSGTGRTRKTTYVECTGLCPLPQPAGGFPAKTGDWRPCRHPGKMVGVSGSRNPGCQGRRYGYGKRKAVIITAGGPLVIPEPRAHCLTQILPQDTARVPKPEDPAVVMAHVSTP